MEVEQIRRRTSRRNIEEKKKEEEEEKEKKKKKKKRKRRNINRRHKRGEPYLPLEGFFIVCWRPLLLLDVGHGKGTQIMSLFIPFLKKIYL